MSGDDEARVFGERYVLGEQIAAGRDDEVWRAHDDVVGRPVALKIFFGARATDPGWRAAFQRDGALLTALSHPGIATLYEAGESDDEAWLAMAYVDGVPLPTQILSTPLAAVTALDILGQTALAVQAAHDAGVAHGALRPASILMRPDGVVSVIGFAVATGATKTDDLRALSELAGDLLAGAETASDAPSGEIKDFLDWLSRPRRGRSAADAADIGRTALALAASLAGKHATAVVPSPTASFDDTATPWYDDTERRRVRNRLIALGAITVIGGGVLLFFLGRGDSDVTVPYVVGLPLYQAQLSLTSAGLQNSDVVTSGGVGSGGTVVSESPTAGERVRAGSTVVLTISQGSP